jgi:hypothetical protein
VRRSFPDVELADMAESCSLDVADRGGASLEEVADSLNLTREQVRTIELRALAKTHLLSLGRRARGVSSPQLSIRVRRPETGP